MKKAILLVVVLAGWFCATHEQLRNSLFSESLSIREKIVHVSNEAITSLFLHNQKHPVKRGSVKVPFQHKQLACDGQTLPLTGNKQKTTNESEQNETPVAPLLIHAL